MATRVYYESMARATITLAVVLLVGVGCERGATSSADSGVADAGSALSTDSAVALAQRALMREPDAATLLPNRVLDVVATDSSYRIRFIRADSARRVPGFALIEIRRADGRATRVPVR